ncbi:hypothetical protein NL676_001798 [Syzygium grande]|nr:hypothetical protein NL676_001798 [Syzygium grande]
MVIAFPLHPSEHCYKRLSLSLRNSSAAMEITQVMESLSHTTVVMEVAGLALSRSVVARGWATSIEAN